MRTRKKLFIIAALTAVSAAMFAQNVSGQQLPYQNPQLTVAQRADDLLSRLTLEEKVRLMMDSSPAVERLGDRILRVARRRIAPKLLFIGDANRFRAVQDAENNRSAVENRRVLRMLDALLFADGPERLAVLIENRNLFGRVRADHNDALRRRFRQSQTRAQKGGGANKTKRGAYPSPFHCLPLFVKRRERRPGRPRGGSL